MPTPAGEARLAVRTGAAGLSAAQALGWGTAAGICAIAYYILKGFFSFTEGTADALVGWIPGVGKWVRSKLEDAEQKATHWVGTAAASAEGRMASAFHSLAVTAESIGWEIQQQALDYWHVVAWIAKVGKDIATGEAFQEIFHNTITSTNAKVKQLQRRQNVQAKQIAHSSTAAALPSLREQARNREDALARDHAATREQTRVAENTNESLWAKVRHLDKVTTGVLASALVASALGRLGAGWIRCSNWGRIGRVGCRLPTHLLDDLLVLLTDFAVLANICTVLPWLEAAFDEVAAPLVDTLAAAGSALRCGGGLGDEVLEVPALYLPAAPSLTLHLP